VKKILFSMAVSLLLFISLTAPAIANPTPVPSGLENAQSAMGLYEISVFKDGQWHSAGSLAYDKHLREKQLDLRHFVPTGKNIKIRLIQKGGGAAHIDAATLKDLAPVSVSGVNNDLALKKISRRDFDVVDSLHKILELTFEGSKTPEDNVLHLTARVEPAHISKAPFKVHPIKAYFV
jgi:hypothetical protein